jgi:hypothetical protein
MWRAGLRTANACSNREVEAATRRGTTVGVALFTRLPRNTLPDGVNANTTADAGLR